MYVSAEEYIPLNGIKYEVYNEAERLALSTVNYLISSLGERFDREVMLAIARAEVWRSREDYSPERGAGFPTWACNCARWAVQKEIRSQFRTNGPVPLDTKVLTRDGCYEREPFSYPDFTLSPYLQSLLEMLEERERTVIYYRFTWCLTISEIAEIMGLSRTTIANALRDGLETLRYVWESD